MESWVPSNIVPLDLCQGEPEYALAFSKIESIVGADQFSYDDSLLQEYAKSTLPKGTLPSGIVYPTSSDEVSAIAKVAHQHHIPLHSISCGKNWGYGGRCAAQDGRVIVDLGRMNAIRDLNIELGYVVVEPGVTQGQLYQYLLDQNAPLVLDVTGAGPDSSIIGNLLQNGFGHSRYGDRFRHTSGFEVVLADGSVIHSGFGDPEKFRAARVYPSGLGPSIDGLFKQSNYGIVTSACVWLMPRPDVIAGFALRFEDNHLGHVINSLRRLRMSGTVTSTVHVANDLRVLSSRIRYPFKGQEPAAPLTDHERRKLRSEHGLGAWNVLGGLYGTKGQVRAAKKVVKSHLRAAGQVHFFDRNRLNFAKRVLAPCVGFGPAKRLHAAAISAGDAFDLLEGIPSNEHLKGAYWRSRDEPDDLRDVGLIWVSPVAPMTASAAAEINEIASSTLNRFGFDYLVTLTAITERALCCVISINYDKLSSKRTQLAGECARELTQVLRDKGYVSYRKSSVPI